MTSRSVIRLSVVGLEPLEPRRLLAADLVISEFLASNDHSITTAAGAHEDWIEIHNRGDADANLNDYFLTDSAGNPEQWRFPAQTLAAGGYVIVFATGEATPPPGTELHANFKLGADGEYLGLIRAADDTPQFEYAPTFPVQSSDVSYGLSDANDPNSAKVFFYTPSPGAPNQFTPAAAVYSQPGRPFTTNPTITLSSVTAPSTIYYTTDGSIPNESSQQYTGGIVISASTVLRTRVFTPDHVGSIINSETYVKLDSTVGAFTSNLPVVMLDTFGATVNDTTLVPASATFVNAGVGGQAGALDTPDFNGRIGLRIRGSTSSGANYPKKQYAVELWDETNNDKKAPLLGMPADSDWVLYAPYSEKSLMNNDLAMKWANEMGQYASRTKFVEVYLNTTPGASITSASYLGVYILMEKVKVASNRVNINKIGPTDNTGLAVTGGYILAKDRTDSGTESSFTTSHSQTYVNVDPDASEITPQQKSYISGFMAQLETALYGSNFADPVNGYAKYIDVGSFVDFYLLSEMTRSVDAFWLSTFFYKDVDPSSTVNSKLTLGPAWDFNLAMGDANYRGGADSAGWNHETLTASQYGYFARLFEDPNFQQKVVDRWQQLRSTVYATPKMMADIDADVAVLANGTTNYPVENITTVGGVTTYGIPTQSPTNAAVRNFQRWNILGQYAPANSFYDPQGRWIEDVKLTKNWLSERLTWMDNNILTAATKDSSPTPGTPTPDPKVTIPTPTLSPAGGDYGSATSVTITPHAPATATDTTLLPEFSPVQWFVPSATDQALGWQATGYTPPASPATAVWTSSTGGVGYDSVATPINFLPYVGAGSNVQSKMVGINTSIYTRWTFNISDVTQIASLILKMRYDDGFVAWVNGVRVMDANSPENIVPTYNTSTLNNGSGNDTLAITLREFDISSVKSLLTNGTNVLAIQGLNSGTGSNDLLIDPVLVSRVFSNASTGTVYYTTDGSDPRLSGGAVNPAATVYSGAIAVSSSTRILARTLTGGVWSGLADEVYNFDANKLRVTELMYNPPAPPSGPFTAQDFEFIEVKNTSTSPLTLNGYHFSDGIVFTFPNTVLPAGGYGVVVHNIAAFQSRYGSSLNVLGAFVSGSLDNGGENVAIEDGFGHPVQSFLYNDSWYPQTDGGGYSLVIRNPLGALPSWSDVTGWRASSAPLGLPGADDTDTTPPAVTARTFDGSTQHVQITFGEAISISSFSGLVLTELLSGSPITPAGSISSTNGATITLPSSMIDGIYRVTLPASAVTDSSGNHPSADAVFTFLYMAGGHTLALPSSGATYALDQLSIGAAATLNVSNDKLIVRGGDAGSWTGSAYTGLSALLASGRNAGSSGTWSGTGIKTSAATSPLNSLGVASASQALGISAAQTGIFGGQTVKGSDVLIKYTYGGDANLDGKINVDDYTRIDFNVPLGVAGWYNGDFNLDGKINVDDYTIIDFNVGIQGPPIASAQTIGAAGQQTARRPAASSMAAGQTLWIPQTHQDSVFAADSSPLDLLA